jgi:catechol 2,3-dioxygenase-like lactoylglutathione lyase family enzyme
LIPTYGLTDLNLRVSDMARSLRFYREVFGLEERFREGDDFVFLGTPGARDVITLDADPASKGRPGEMGGISHFGFRIKSAADLSLALRSVEAAGGTVIRQGSDEGRVYAYVRDPDGYEIELFDE